MSQDTRISHRLSKEFIELAKLEKLDFHLMRASLMNGIAKSLTSVGSSTLKDHLAVPEDALSELRNGRTAAGRFRHTIRVLETLSDWTDRVQVEDLDTDVLAGVSRVSDRVAHRLSEELFGVDQDPGRTGEILSDLVSVFSASSIPDRPLPGAMDTEIWNFSDKETYRASKEIMEIVDQATALQREAQKADVLIAQLHELRDGIIEVNGEDGGDLREILAKIDDIEKLLGDAKKKPEQSAARVDDILGPSSPVLH